MNPSNVELETDGIMNENAVNWVTLENKSSICCFSSSGCESCRRAKYLLGEVHRYSGGAKSSFTDVYADSRANVIRY